jgi:hypothetical protein
VEEVKEVEDVKDEDSGEAESCLARKLASFGMAVQPTIHRSEYKAKLTPHKSTSHLLCFHKVLALNSRGFYLTVTQHSYLCPSFLRRDSG